MQPQRQIFIEFHLQPTNRFHINGCKSDFPATYSAEDESDAMPLHYSATQYVSYYQNPKLTCKYENCSQSLPMPSPDMWSLLQASANTMDRVSLLWSGFSDHVEGSSIFCRGGRYMRCTSIKLLSITHATTDTAKSLTAISTVFSYNFHFNITNF